MSFIRIPSLPENDVESYSDPIAGQCRHSTSVPKSWNDKDERGYFKYPMQARELAHMTLIYMNKNGRPPKLCEICSCYDFTPVNKADERRQRWLSNSGSLRYIEGRLVES